MVWSKWSKGIKDHLTDKICVEIDMAIKPVICTMMISTLTITTRNKSEQV